MYSLKMSFKPLEHSHRGGEKQLIAIFTHPFKCLLTKLFLKIPVSFKIMQPNILICIHVSPQEF